MSHPLVVKSSVSIDAPAAKVWNALTDPESTKKYMFGCAALSDWKPGSPLIWKGVFNNVEMVAVKGQVVRFEPHRLLVYTVIDPNNPGIPDVPENYLTVTCELREEGGRTELTVSQGDYNTVAEGAVRYEHSVKGGGWGPILVQIKALVEA